MNISRADGLPVSAKQMDAAAEPSASAANNASGAADAMSRSSWKSLNSGVDMLQPWEKEALQSPEVQRKATIAQLCMSPANRLSESLL